MSKKHIGLVVIFIAFLVLAFFAYDFFKADKQENGISQSKSESENTNIKRVNSDDDAKYIDESGDGEIKEDVAKAKMNLTLVADENVKKHIENFEALKSKIEEFLIKNDLWSEVKTANISSSILIDYTSQKSVYDVYLDDGSKSSLVVSIFFSGEINIEFGR